jgi:hypothetical protein
MKMPWGKHKGVDVTEVPESYLRWALENASNISPTLKEAIRHQLGLPPEVTNGEATALILAKVDEAVREAYRQASVRHHPDRGGSAQAMAAINDFRDRLKTELEKRLSKSSSKQERSNV